MQNKFQVVVPQIHSGDQSRSVLYLSDLPSNVTESDIQLFFDEFKDSIVVITINAGGKNDFAYGKSPSARVIFKDSTTANEARRAKNMTKIKGKTIRVMWDERDNSLRYNNQTNLFVKNIPFEIKPREFYEFFLKFGDIISAKVPEDEEGNHLGYGYINYYDSESADKAIKATDDKEVWGSKLEVKHFQKKNERLSSFPQINNCLYVKNFPAKFIEGDLKKLCAPFGEITSCKINADDFNRRYAIVTFASEEACQAAKNSLSGKKMDEENELFVDILMNKNERKRILSTKIMDTNYRLNEQYKFCNMHIRNIPYNAKEEDLIEAFKQFGPIKSVKIEKYMLVTKENNELKEIPTSKGFGYICFEEPEAAKAAIENMDGKFLPKYETWKRPLLVDYFMPKHERTPFVVSKINQISSTGPKNPLMSMNPMMNPNYMLNPMAPMGHPQRGMQNLPQNMPNMPPNMMMNPQMVNYGAGQQNVPTKRPTQPKPKVQTQESAEKDDLDYNYIQTLDDDSKRDYLGEFLFKKIENHKLSQDYNLTIDTIGKITGMILGIEDISEIMDIYKNSQNLTARMREALELINQK